MNKIEKSKMSMYRSVDSIVSLNDSLVKDVPPLEAAVGKCRFRFKSIRTLDMGDILCFALLNERQESWITALEY